MKQTWKTALVIGLPYSFIMIFFKSLSKDGLTSSTIAGVIITGVVFGFLFAIGMKYYRERLYKEIIIELNSSESIIIEGGANHFKGKEGVGGKLVLTDQRLIFKSHKFNAQNHELALTLNEIKGISETKTLGILNNGLTIELITNESHRFIVDVPAVWVNEIESRIPKESLSV